MMERKFDVPRRRSRPRPRENAAPSKGFSRRSLLTFLCWLGAAAPPSFLSSSLLSAARFAAAAAKSPPPGLKIRGLLFSTILVSLICSSATAGGGGGIGAASRFTDISSSRPKFFRTSGTLPLRSSSEVRRCNSTCDPSKRDVKVCGSDGRTYESECDLARAACHGASVRLAGQGPCKESRCLIDRKEAQQELRELTRQQQRGQAVGAFNVIPECRPDGSYNPVQCHLGYCWCVNVEGKVIPGSTVQSKKPSCRSSRDSEERDRGERSPPMRKKKGKHPESGCTQSDREKFNKNLIGQFRQEFDRVPRLSRRDKPNDKPVSFKLFLSLNSEENSKSSSKTSLSKKEGGRHTKKRPSDLWPDYTRSKGYMGEQGLSAETPSCTQERENALANESKDPNGGIFVPDCAPNGNYRQEQCHRGTGYCWCVDQEDGRPITGTATHNVKPNCDANPERELRGCPGLKKRRFVTKLMETFKAEMTTFLSNSSNANHKSLKNVNSKMSVDEKAAVWKHAQLDEDMNGLIERRERRDLKRELRKVKKLKKCRKYFVEFCDEDDDKTVTLKEWLTCTALTQNRGMNRPMHPKRRGPNPFSKYLNSDRR